MKRSTALCAIALLLLALTACAPVDDDLITVVSREDGSGTRGAFIELLGVEETTADGNKVDKTLDTAEITDNTAVMMTSISGNQNAIGYISLGSLNDTVKALSIDGAPPTAANIKNGSYAVARPFNIATKENLSDIARDFIDYILSTEGQDVVEEKGYVRLDNTQSYAGSKPSGKVVVAGSSSVTPAMEALKEAYCKLNAGAAIEIQQSDSTTGMNAVIDGVCDIGMASRALKDSETAKGVTGTVIAMDGIVIIVNKERDIDNLSKDQVKAIYTGSITTWSEIG